MGRNKRQSSRHQTTNRNQDPKRVRGQVVTAQLSPSSSPPFSPEAAPSPSVAAESKQVPPSMPAITLSPPSSTSSAAPSTASMTEAPPSPRVAQVSAHLSTPAGIELEKKTPELRPAPPPTVNFWFAGKKTGGDEKPVKSPFVDDRDFPILRTSLFTNSQASLSGPTRQSSVGDSDVDGTEWVSVADQTMVAEDSLPAEPANLTAADDKLAGSVVLNDDEWTFV